MVFYLCDRDPAIVELLLELSKPSAFLGKFLREGFDYYLSGIRQDEPAFHEADALFKLSPATFICHGQT